MLARLDFHSDPLPVHISVIIRTFFSEPPRGALVFHFHRRLRRAVGLSLPSLDLVVGDHLSVCNISVCPLGFMSDQCVNTWPLHCCSLVKPGFAHTCCSITRLCLINFRNVETCERFMNDFDGVECRVCLPGFNSAKVCRVTHARVQGLEGNIRHLRNSTIMRDLARHPDWQPLIFTENGDPLPLPKHLPQGQEAGQVPCGEFVQALRVIESCRPNSPCGVSTSRQVGDSPKDWLQCVCLSSSQLRL